LAEQWERWKLFAHAARYGNQPLTVALGGRHPTAFELGIFFRALDYWLEAESPDSDK
jgi:hypothetical protein